MRLAPHKSAPDVVSRRSSTTLGVGMGLPNFLAKGGKSDVVVTTAHLEDGAARCCWGSKRACPFLSSANLALRFSQARSCDPLLLGDSDDRHDKGEIAMEVKTEMKQVGIVAMVLAVSFLVVCQSVALAQNLGAAPQVNVAVQGQTGAQPEGAFLNFVNWVGNVIAPVGAGVAVLGGIVSYASGRGYIRWIGTALGLLAVSGLTRLLEFWIQQGTGGVS